MCEANQPRLPSFGLISTKYNENKVSNSNLISQNVKTRYDNSCPSGLDACYIGGVFRFNGKDMTVFKHGAPYALVLRNP